MTTQLLLASNNRGKLREMQDLLGGLFELVLPHNVGITLDVDETGATYAENAALKARAFHLSSGLLTLADDSGLEVDALGGHPGLYSSRFAPDPNPTDAIRRAYLLQLLAPLPQPWTARFRCTVAIAAPGMKELYYAEGICEGVIIPQERGSNGFGYDPIFWLPDLGKTMAELTTDEKNRLSHRARAVKAAVPILRQLSGQ
jgi:XTP/dITP diphosphohydrolase